MNREEAEALWERVNATEGWRARVGGPLAYRLGRYVKRVPWRVVAWRIADEDVDGRPRAWVTFDDASQWERELSRTSAA